jgi:hypothetical protein
VLNRKRGRRPVAKRKTVCPLDAVAEPSHRAAIAPGRLAAATLVPPVGLATAFSTLTAFRPRRRLDGVLSRWRFARWRHVLLGW